MLSFGISNAELVRLEYNYILKYLFLHKYQTETNLKDQRTMYNISNSGIITSKLAKISIINIL